MWINSTISKVERCFKNDACPSSALLLMIAVAPLVGALAAGLFGKTIGRTGAHSVTIAGVALSFLLSVWTLWQVIQGAGYDGTVYEWMRVATPFGALKFEVGFLIDALT